MLKKAVLYVGLLLPFVVAANSYCAIGIDAESAPSYEASIAAVEDSSLAELRTISTSAIGDRSEASAVVSQNKALFHRVPSNRGPLWYFVARATTHVRAEICHHFGRLCSARIVLTKNATVELNAESKIPKTRSQRSRRSQDRSHKRLRPFISYSAALGAVTIALASGLTITLKALRAKDEMLLKAIMEARASDARADEVNGNLKELTEQSKVTTSENAAIKSALKAALDERDSLQVQLKRALFERGNFKDVLQRELKQPEDRSKTPRRFQEDTDVLGMYAEKQWQLNQELAAANAATDAKSQEVECLMSQLAQIGNDLDEACYTSDVEREKAKSLQVERDLYMKFAKLSSTQKKNMARLLSDLYRQQHGEERRLKRVTHKLDRAIATFCSDIHARQGSQRKLLSALASTVSALQINIRGVQPYTVPTGFYAALCAGVQECSSVCQDVVATMEAQERDFENHTGEMQRLVDLI